jgi:hypothetical protein
MLETRILTLGQGIESSVCSFSWRFSFVQRKCRFVIIIIIIIITIIIIIVIIITLFVCLLTSWH